MSDGGKGSSSETQTAHTKIALYKEQGNTKFKAKDFSAALDCYTQGIDLSIEVCGYPPDITDESPEAPEVALLIMLLCNRALCNIKLEAFGSALKDATLALDYSRNKSAKASFRRATALVCMTQYDQAVRDFRRAAQLAPEDKLGPVRLKEAQRLLREQRFAEAIKKEDAQPLSATIDLNDYPYDDSYVGPKFNGGSEELNLAYFERFISYLKENTKNRLHRRVLIKIALDVLSALKAESTAVKEVNLADTDERITICGDVHGQFYDFLEIFKKNGYPAPNNKYLFNGDFVDRGPWGLECVTTLYLAKLIWPDSVFLNRGNHESRRMTKLYGFRGEMGVKASATIYELFCETFDWLPIVHIINGRIFVVHGGLSKNPDTKLEDIRKLQVGREETEDGDDLLTDLLWSDPQDALGHAPSKRGNCYCFGPDITSKFLSNNNLELIIRSHETKQEGYEVTHNKQLITVFSAPNYCDTMGNKGAYVCFTGKDLNSKEKRLNPMFTNFNCVPHPPAQAMQYADCLVNGP